MYDVWVYRCTVYCLFSYSKPKKIKFVFFLFLSINRCILINTLLFFFFQYTDCGIRPTTATEIEWLQDYVRKSNNHANQQNGQKAQASGEQASKADDHSEEDDEDEVESTQKVDIDPSTLTPLSPEVISKQVSLTLSLDVHSESNDLTGDYQSGYASRSDATTDSHSVS